MVVQFFVRPPKTPINGLSFDESFIHLDDSDGSDPRVIGVSPYSSWSPDGSRVAQMAQFVRPFNVDVVGTKAADGSNLQVLVTRDEDGLLKPTNEDEDEDKTCFLWLCW